jgi:putative ABC transport system permease protein
VRERGRASRVVRLYGLLLRLFPPAIRAADGEEMADAFASQWQEAAGRRRLAASVRAFRRLPAVVAAEWWDAVRARRRGLNQRRSGGGMRGFGRMLRYGARSLRRTPAFTLSVVLLLGLGVGSVSAIWAVVDHVLLRPLPYPAVDRLFRVENGSHSGPSFEDFQAMPSVEAWSAVMTTDANITGAGDPLRVRQGSVTRGFFEMFAARPLVGRLLVDDDFRSGDGVVLSSGLWRRLYGGDSGVVGRTIRIDGVATTVLGVLDPSFLPPEALTSTETEVWRPIAADDAMMQTRNFVVLSVAGRLAPGATLADAEREAQRVAEARAEAFPDHYVNRNGDISTLPVVSLQEATVGSVRRGLGLLLGAVTLLLLVACANVTHLFLARGVARVREMSVRRALGAGRRAIAGQLLVESLLLGLGGAVVGIALAYAALRGFLVVDPGGLPRVASVALDVRVLAFAALIGVATAVAFGLLPALRVTGGSVSDVLRQAGRSVTGSRGAQAGRNALVVAEVALSLVLVAQAGWLLRSFIRLHEQPLGFRTEGVVTLPMTPTGIETPAEWHRRMEAVRASLADVPGVSAATFALAMPLEFTGGGRCCWSTRLTFGGAVESQRQMIHPVGQDFFEMLELQVLAGRTWDRTEASAETQPAVVSEPLALGVFGSANAALGQTFDLRGGPDETRQFRVIGVVADNRFYGPDQEHGPAIYVPIEAIADVPPLVHMAVLTDRLQPGFAEVLREAVWRVEPNLAVPLVRPMAEWATVATARSRFESALVGSFAVVALLLVGGGLAGTLLYSVSLQRRDLGIRLALGSTAGRLERRVLGHGLGMAALGAAIGGAGAWASGRLIESRLFGVDARDLRTLALATFVLLLSALLFSWLPARRAARTDPMESLRTE